MYVNAKMIPVETISGMGGVVIKERSGGSELKYDVYLIHHKNICKCHNIPPPHITIKKK
jgi:hypothetical protein